MTPVILLAFANDKRDSGSGFLRGLTAERNAIRDALMKAEENGLCQVLIEPDATIERLFDIFQNSAYRDRISIFHYGGHAESYSLLLETASGEQSTAHSEGLVSFLSKQKSLKLVFLNGCSSQKQSEDLIEAGLPAVIGTSQVINDGIATSLASRFYKGLSQGLAIDPSWTDAVDQIKTETGTENTAKLFSGSLLKKPGKDQFPWNLYYGEGAAVSKAWNLPEAANQPLFGLDLPKTYFRKLPQSPYVGLRSFHRQEAAVFHGRGTDIRKLYTQIQREQPVILVSGKKGVGKSSMLSAGLAPRLEAESVVSLCPIGDQGIMDSLYLALDQAREENGIEKLAPKDKSNLKQKISEIEKQIPVVSGFAKDILTYELDRLVRQAAMEQLSFHEQWMAIEEQTGKPLHIVLDELPTDQNEWEPLLVAIVSIFENAHPPQGKLVISVDEQDHAAFAERLQASNFPPAEMFLQPLSKDELQEAIMSVTTSPLTKDFYRLEIEDNNINSLPGTLTKELLEGDTTLAGPYLQVILSALWKDAVKQDAQHPSISVSVYQEGILSGKLMDDFLSGQLNQIEKWQPDIVQSGLALDLLSLHTSAMGKSKILEVPKRNEIYGDRADLVEKLASKCCELFLLTKAHAEATNLGHNMLAPSLIRNYSISLYPGQQASRILNGKMSEALETESKVWLNEAELAVVEAGIQGMRQLTEEEEELLAFSREKKIQAEKERKRNRVIRTVLVSIVAVVAVIATLFYFQSEKNYKESWAGEIASKAREQLDNDNTLALRLAISAYGVLNKKSPPLVKATLADVYYSQEDQPFYTSKFQHEKTVHTAAFSPINDNILTASEDGLVTLWDKEGREIKSFDHVYDVQEAIFSPGGNQILSRTKTHIYLWNIENEELVDKDSITSFDDVLANHSTDVMKITQREKEPLDSSMQSVIDTLLFKYYTIALSPDQKTFLAYPQWGGPISLYGLNGQLLKDSLHLNVKNASFSGDGSRFITVSPDPESATMGWVEVEFRKSFITIWSAAGDSIFGFECKGDQVNAVLSKEGDKVLTASNDFTAKLWDFSIPFIHRFPKQSQAINTIDYDENGKRYLTSSPDYTVKIWNESAQVIDSLKHNDIVNTAWFSPDGNHIVTASEDGTAQIWSPKEDIRSVVLQHQDEVKSAVFSHDGQQVLTASEDSLVCLWNLKGEKLKSYNLTNWVLEAIFSPDDQIVLARIDDTIVKLIYLANDSIVAFSHPDKINSIAFSPDGQQFLTTCRDNLAREWSVSGGLLDTFRHFNQPLKGMYTGDGKYILTGGQVIKIWNRKGELQDSLFHRSNISSISISPDNQQVFTTTVEHGAFLWGLSKGNLLDNDAGDDILGRKLRGNVLATYDGHEFPISMGIFTPDGKNLLTASNDQYVLRWKTPQAIYDELKTKDFYNLTNKELEEFKIVK